MEHLANFLPKGSLVCFSLLHKDLSPQIPDNLKWIPIKYHEKPNEGWPNLPFMVGPLLSFLGEAYFKYFVLRKIVKEVVDFGKKHKVNCLWVVLEGQTTVRLALKVAKKLNVPMVSEVWDPPEWANRNNHLDKLNRTIILKQFGQVLHHSEFLGTASWAMADQYGRDYKVKAISFLPSLETQDAYPASSRIKKRKELVIAVAGQLYSNDEWRAFLEALHQINWQIAGMKVKMRLLGNWFGLDKVYQKMNIEYLGWCSQKETVKLMNEADILYCPYYFDEQYKKVAQLSFPSKLATYLAAGRPVFFHGPTYASPGIFLRENRAAMLCHSLESKKIIECLTKMVVDKKLYSSLAKNGHQAFLEYLTRNVLRQKFAQFLDIPETDLLPVK